MAPLLKRVPREFRNNLGKYLGIFLLFLFAIMMGSGFLSAAHSIEVLQKDMHERHSVEDFHFATQFEAAKRSIEAVEEMGCTVYEDFTADVPMFVSGDERPMNCRLINQDNRVEVNRGYYFEGVAPAAEDEIALDRVWCKNNNISVGDTVEVGGRQVKVTGIMSLSDYECLMEKNTDMLFNSTTFSVALVTPEGFRSMAGAKKDYRYDVILDDRSMDLVARTNFEKDAATLLADHDEILTDLTDYEFDNKAIFFANDDVDSDQTMWEVLVMLLVVIMAFVFVVLTNATIEQESAVIGTLLASGYRKREIVAHYMVLPTIIGILGCAAGNYLGLTFMSTPMQELYYGSYSLPPYEYTFSPRVFGLTTVVPFTLLEVVTLLGLMRKLRFTPLAFLRREVANRSRRATLPLPERIGFVRRFQLRVLLRNLSHFVVLFFGISFCSLFLLFGLCLMPVVDHYSELLKSDVVANHIYLLKAPLELEGTPNERAAYKAVEDMLEVEDPLTDLGMVGYARTLMSMMDLDDDAHPVNTTDNGAERIAQAEKFAAASLAIDHVVTDSSEEITVYGISQDSRYWPDVDVSDGAVVIGTGLSQKCRIKPGDAFSLFDKYTNKTYELVATDVWGSSSNMNVYMEMSALNRLVDEDEDRFMGYASDEELELDQRYLATDITPESMSTSADQMQESFGDMMGMVVAFAIPVYLILVYLLTKTVIDRSSRYISYMKVFGYHNSEISRLYVRAITVTVLVSLVASLPFVIWLCDVFVGFVMDRYSGNLEIYIEPPLLMEVVAIGAAAYVAVALIHLWRIRRVGLAEAMKVQE
ncbi:MAG: FtsX-like permease family protein [Atopobiaceae bacterium]|nr:FtsX-like permease family protein [Atopobiaceae bacterium]